MALALASCSEKDSPVVSPDEPQVNNLADVTVMIYGSGGGNLDKNMVNKFRRLYDADSKVSRNRAFRLLRSISTCAR